MSPEKEQEAGIVKPVAYPLAVAALAARQAPRYDPRVLKCVDEQAAQAIKSLRTGRFLLKRWPVADPGTEAPDNALLIA